ncbi:MAG: Gfo/Idh/MocA family oxidoreductase [Sphingobacteriales bacterium]|nr:Gfo/Idh/MocA family oxidoreductase [Sphingobacteriales bacterium]OJY81851.1 MAG: hypothetical protein BGP14_03580 [Sphingobacteriales bacterium 44-15]
MNKTIRWGILGCGRIARKFASDLRLVKNAVPAAVASRDKLNADNFGRESGADQVYYNYEDLANSKDVDIIYVATPHGLHFEHVMLCLQHDKAVLCEKAFAINAKQANIMIETARKKNLFLMEALWSKFLPSYQKMIQMIEEGKLGKINNVLINFGFIPQAPVAPRIFDPALGGGALLDIGVYNVFFALSALGKPHSIEASMTSAVTGVDEQCAILFRYDNGAIAQLFSSFSSHLPTEANISGDKGRLLLGHRFYAPESTLEYYPGRYDTKQIVEVEKVKGWGYHYEIAHAGECLRKGLTESPVITHADTLLLMETLDDIRKKAGLRYPAD